MGEHTQSNALNGPECTGVLNETDAKTVDGGLDKSIIGLKYANDRTYEIHLYRVILLLSNFVGALIGVYLMFTSAKSSTIIFSVVLVYITGFGITAGAHRLWAHRTYKAKLPLRILLVIFQTIAYQMSVIDWVLDHRVHHKYSETDADPYNAKRGLFFSHLGWMLCKKHPENIAKRKEMDVSDLESDPLLYYQKKYYDILLPIAYLILPTWIPVYFWNETVFNALCIAVAFRFEFVTNIASCVNSFAHFYGKRRYDKFINPADNKIVGTLAMGEGWHNYHHTFPWDYKTSELGNYGTNLTTLFIDSMAKIGWAYDLKTVSAEMIRRRVERTGDGTHWTYGRHKNNEIDGEKEEF